MRPFLIATTLVVLASCSSAPPVSAPASSVAKIEAQIVRACLASGLFKMANGVVLEAGSSIKAVVDAGVDKVCADPARFAANVDTAVWVARNLRDIVAALPATR